MNKKRLRLSVFRSNKWLYSQIIDDQKGVTLVSAKGKEPFEVGKALAEKALKLKIKRVWLDRGRYRYHGQIKSLSEGAREGGLEF